MLIKGFIEEDIVNYYKTSMFIGTAECDWKCDIECGKNVCQNSNMALSQPIDIPVEKLVKRYLNNEITRAVVFGGLEPMLQINDIVRFIKILRSKDNKDPVIIYTGYYPEEIGTEINQLKKFSNVIIKFGRFIPDSRPKMDELLKVQLASQNQYAKRIEDL